MNWMDVSPANVVEIVAWMIIGLTLLACALVLVSACWRSDDPFDRRHRRRMKRIKQMRREHEAWRWR